MQHESLPDDRLLAKLVQGDMAALGELATRHQQRMLGLAYRMLGRWDSAQDAVQEAFLRVARTARRHKPSVQFSTWLHRIVINQCIDVRRRWGRRPPHVDADAVVVGSDPGPDPVEAEEQVRRIRQAIDALPERQRTAVILHRYEELSHKEIAAAAGWSVSAVESLLVRAYANLREALADLAES